MINLPTKYNCEVNVYHPSGRYTRLFNRRDYMGFISAICEEEFPCVISVYDINSDELIYETSNIIVM
jgi:hypothetical protein